MYDDHVQYNPAYRTFPFANCYIGLVITLFFLNAIRRLIGESECKTDHAVLKPLPKKNQKSDHLLLNVLPEDIAEELKIQRALVKQDIMTSVYFVLLILSNFTKYSETITPANLISELHHFSNTLIR